MVTMQSKLLIVRSKQFILTLSTLLCKLVKKVYQYVYIIMSYMVNRWNELGLGLEGPDSLLDLHKIKQKLQPT